jgi:hypothetical protein
MQPAGRAGGHTAAAEEAANIAASAKREMEQVYPLEGAVVVRNDRRADPRARAA